MEYNKDDISIPKMLDRTEYIPPMEMKATQIPQQIIGETMIPSKEMLDALNEADKDGILASSKEEPTADIQPTGYLPPSVSGGDAALQNSQDSLMQEIKFRGGDKMIPDIPPGSMDWKTQPETNSAKVRPNNYKSKKKAKRKASRKARRK